MSQAQSLKLDAGAQPAGGVSKNAARRANRIKILRPILMIGGVAVVIIGSIIFWLSSGRYITITDTLVSAATLSVSTDVSGLVSSVEVKDNQHVTRGQVLLRLDTSQFQIAVAGAQANLNQVRLDVEASRQTYRQLLSAIAVQQSQVDNDNSDFRRYAALVSNGGVTKSSYDAAKFKLAGDQARLGELQDQAKVQLAKLAGNADIKAEDTPQFKAAAAQLAEAQRQLRHAVIRAPFSGVVTSVDTVQPGMFLQAGTAAFGLVSDQDVWIRSQPKETELTWVRPGDPVKISIDTYPGEKWNGNVASISPASGSTFAILPAQDSSGNWVKVVQRIPLRVDITGGPQDWAEKFPLRAGMSAEVTIDTGHKRHLSDLF